MNDPDSVRLARLRLLGWLLILFSLAVVGVSAWLRLAAAGLGCADWPACYAGLPTGAAYAPPAGGRMIHRFVATGALLLAIYACWLSLKPVPLPNLARHAFRLLGLMLLLAVVGIWSRDPSRVLVNFVNLAGGLVLVPLAWRLATASSREVPCTVPTSAAAVAGALFLLAAVLFGAAIGARYAAVDASIDGLALHWLHRLCAVAAFLLLGWAAWRRPDSKPARALLLLLGLEILLGMLLVLGGSPLWAGIAHNVVAAMALAAVAQLGFRRLAARESGRCGG